ncbi:MAG: phosphoribosylformylglycinamidine cyclo-ligase [Acidobacteriota bacterium]|nr:MAG: phosphoribosylformylglycinamidine cyclo-ligase [Acidobacteriota bacterium]
MSAVDYRQSGVNIDAGNEAVRRIRALARGTYTPGVLSGVGSFGGLFALDGTVPEPVLVSSADGVGTKLKVAFMAGVHDTIGEDLVNHCVNDILVQGARPLFFLDYLATGALAPDVVEQIVAGVARACRENRCALLGGETAEMPGFYQAGEYDIAGFIVGIVSRSAIIDGSRIEAGDQLIALPSSGLHTNGYSLARRIAFDVLGLGVDSYVDELGATVGEELLRPHRSYLAAIEPLLAGGRIRGMAHITGGGITENLPRTLPEGLHFSIDRGSWTIPPVFAWLQASGRVDDAEMFRTFNMGVGLILVCAPGDVDGVLRALEAAGERPWRIGEVVPAHG